MVIIHLDNDFKPRKNCHNNGKSLQTTDGFRVASYDVFENIKSDIFALILI